MGISTFLALFAMGLLAPRPVAAQTQSELVEQVRTAEAAFAETMARRDLAAFASFVADDAVFLGRGPLRGRDAVREGWKTFYEGAVAPFSWKPETVEVLANGTLGLSSGPVFDASGKRTGTFNSVWRREPDGKWRVVFDKGCPACDCGAGKP